MKGLVLGALAVVAIAFLMGASGGDAPTSVLSATLVGVATMTLLGGVRAPAGKRRLRPSLASRAFSTPKQLRDAREKLSASRGYHVNMLQEKRSLRARLVALREKMEAVALPAYRTRIASIDVALGTIDKQMEIATRLRDGYDKSITMIDIELESGAAAHHMHEDVSALIAESMRELRMIAESQEELARQLEANVEVELLLRR